jgi:two-component system CheB/CheR fusion protein
LHELPFAASPVAQLVVGMDDTLVMQSDQAANLFGLSQRDIGRPIRELEVSYQPLPLRSHLDQVLAEPEPVRIFEVEFGRPGGVVPWFELHLNPVVDGSELLGVSVVFFTTSARPGRCESSSTGRTGSSRPPTTNCSPPTKNSRRPTRSSSRRWRSWRRRTRNSNQPTKNWRR